MSIDLEPLVHTTRVLFSIGLKPLQGERFQPTGFPSLGAATYQTRDGSKLLVESAQSMANRMEMACWDIANDRPLAALDGVSHVTITRQRKFLTDTMLEAHRLNSPYLLESKKDKSFLKRLSDDLRASEPGPVDRKLLAAVLFRYDAGCLLHGVFISKPEFKGGRLRVTRALSAFIEACGVRVAPSGGVKNDHVHPNKVDGDSKNLFGNIPFSRDEFTADRLDLHVNLDLAQIRGYGLGANAERLLILLALHRVRRLLDGDLRLRTACDLEPVNRTTIVATRPEGFRLPSLTDLERELPVAIAACKDSMNASTFAFEDELKAVKESKRDPGDDGDDDEEATSEDKHA